MIYISLKNFLFNFKQKMNKIKIHKFCENIFHCLSCGSIDYKFWKTLHAKI